MAVLEALFLLSVFAAPVLAQPGFLSLDCGLTEGSDYTDTETGISYVPDRNFTVGGESREIASTFFTNSQLKRQWYRTVRTFPERERNCYTLPVENGSRYWVRASFMHGNYDGSNALPQFDLYLGLNKWTTVSLQNASQTWWTEMVTLATMEFITVCLLNVGQGNPFISVLELRRLNSSMYQHANERQSLVVYGLHDIFGDRPIRYPDDRYDRLWMPYTQDNAPQSWERLTTSQPIRNIYTGFEPPPAVMKTAATLHNGSGNVLIFNWSTTDPDTLFHCYRHHADFQNTSLRKFYLSDDGGSPAYVHADYLSVQYIYTTQPVTGRLFHSFTMEKAESSTLLPILNAVEIYTVLLLNQSSTNTQDVDAIMGTKKEYKVKRDWMGDPCLPVTLTWDGLRCSYDTPFPPRIVFLNLSSSGLTGNISISLGKLTWIQHLDLSNNNLTGPIPEFLANLSYLTNLSLSGNNFTSIPSLLLDKSKSGLLSLSVDKRWKIRVTDSCNTTDPCSHGSCERHRKAVTFPVIISSLVTVAVVLLIALLFWSIFGRRHTGAKEDWSLGIESRSFAYSEIANITNSFRQVIGKGANGTVYHGHMIDGSEVAIKLLCEGCQALQQFQTEAQLLIKLYHRNLVRLIGYCAEGDKMALVFEYMSKGSLKKCLSESKELLSWSQRLQIAVDVAQGLEYLHTGCWPPIIHRDVKPENILLNERLEAKITDFRISKVFWTNYNTHITTEVKGTVGYLDPDYHTTHNLTKKSDVYSFGVVLLQLITGQEAIIKTSEIEEIDVANWVSPLISKGDIVAIVDPRLHEQHNADSAWKAVEIAMDCTQPEGVQRPTMSDVVAELKDCLKLETAGTESIDSKALLTFPSENLMLFPASR